MINQFKENLLKLPSMLSSATEIKTLAVLHAISQKIGEGNGMRGIIEQSRRDPISGLMRTDAINNARSAITSTLDGSLSTEIALLKKSGCTKLKCLTRNRKSGNIIKQKIIEI